MRRTFLLAFIAVAGIHIAAAQTGDMIVGELYCSPRHVEKGSDKVVMCAAILPVSPLTSVYAVLYDPSGASIGISLEKEALSDPSLVEYTARVQSSSLKEGENRFRIIIDYPWPARDKALEEVITLGRPRRGGAGFEKYVLPLFGLASLMIMVLLVFWAYAYMVGSKIDESHARDRLIKYVVVLFFSLFLMLGGWQWLEELLGTVGVNTIQEQAEDFLLKQQGIIAALMISIAGAKALLGTISSSKVFTFVITFRAGELIAPLVKLLDTIFYRMLYIQIALFMHLALLQLGQGAGMRVFTPAGMILRLVPGLERVGGFLMAFGIALYFAFPMIILYIYEPASERYLEGANEAKTAADSIKTVDIIAMDNLPDPFNLQKTVNDIIDALMDKIKALELFVAKWFVFWVVLPLFNVAALILVVIALTEFLGERDRGLSRVLQRIMG